MKTGDTMNKPAQSAVNGAAEQPLDVRSVWLWGNRVPWRK
jgi:hypothetical protein